METKPATRSYTISIARMSCVILALACSWVFPSQAATQQLDVVFGIDLTGSMGGEIASVQSNATDIMNRISILVPDSAFGVVSIVDYPHYYSSYGYSDVYGDAGWGDYAFRKDLDITTNRAAVGSAINSLRLHYGGDGPQDYVRMLYEAEWLSWRPGAAHILIVFGDAPAHDPHLFSQSYGGDPGRDEIMFTWDDLDYETVIQQVRAAGIVVVSVDGGGSFSGSDYEKDTYTNFEYMASQTNGRHFLLGDASEIPSAIMSLIQGSLTEEFVWQEVVLDGVTYSVMVRAPRRPQDPSLFVYPVFDGTADPGYNPQGIRVLDDSGNVVTNSERIAEVLAVARNASLYRSWKNAASDPVGTVAKVGGVQAVVSTPPEDYCFLGLWPCYSVGGGTATSFGYSYPGTLVFPSEYRSVNGVARLVDWDVNSDWHDVVIRWASGDYLHPKGIADYQARVDVYSRVIRDTILQDGVSGLAGPSDLISTYEQAARVLELSTGTEALAAKIRTFVSAARNAEYIHAAIQFKDLDFTRSELLQLSQALNAPNNYTGVAVKLAPKLSNGIGVALSVLGPLMRAGGDYLAAYTFALEVQDHGSELLNAFDTHLFSSYSGDPAVSAAFQQVKAELSPLARTSFEDLLKDQLLSQMAGHGSDYVLDGVQLGLSVGALASAGTIVGTPVAGVCTALNIGISVVRFGGGLIVQKIEHEKQQQAVVLTASLETGWWSTPLRSSALAALPSIGNVTAESVEDINWLVSTKLYQGAFVADKVLDENSQLIDLIRQTLGDAGIAARRSALATLRKRLVNVFQGLGDSDPNLKRIAGSKSSQGRYIGFVPIDELDTLVGLTSGRGALAGHALAVVLHSPGDVGLRDPAGRQLGTWARPVNESVNDLVELAEIPGATDTGRGTEPRVLVIPEPMSGYYKIQLIGEGIGAYTLEIQTRSGDRVLSSVSENGNFLPSRLEDAVVRVDVGVSGFDAIMSAPPLARGGIEGIVTNALSGGPIEGATIETGDAVGVTDKDGRFAIANVQPGVVVVRGRASAYLPYQSVEVTLPPGEVMEYSFVMMPANDPPAANAGPDQVVECTSEGRGIAHLDGANSADPNSTPGTNDDIVSFGWSEGGAPVASGVEASVPFHLGSHDVTLTVTDKAGATGTDDLNIRVQDTTPPVLTCPPNFQVECQSAGEASVLVPPASATDSCYGTAVVANDRTSGGADASGSYPLGTTRITFTATDGSRNTSSCETMITVVDTTPPVLTCPALGAIECTSPAGAFASLTASATDTCSPTVQIQNDHTPGGANASGTYPLGTASVHYTATDSSGNHATCSTGVTVRDTTPPVLLGLGINPMFLWPPNHTMRDVAVDYTATDVCSAVTCSLSVMSNEPISGTGDGDTAPDWIVVDDHAPKLRAERAGGGTGRTYKTGLVCSDAFGNSVPATLPDVRVRHDMGSPASGSAFKINTPVGFLGSFWDIPGRTHTAQWTFDGLTSPSTITESTASRPGSVRGTYAFSSTGVYTVKMNVTDLSGATGTADAVGGVNALVVIYDPNGGYVTGGGWLDSPPGAYRADPNLTGKVNLGFVSKYFKNATNPKGETEFDFRLANFKFNALNFDYLMISGAKAMYKGFGKVNGDAGYSFILTVIDGQATNGGGVDKFRIKIWNRTTGAIVYDTQMGAPDNADPVTPVGVGSSIVIQP